MTSVQRLNKIKALVEMGHPVTSCVVVDQGLRGGHVHRHDKCCRSQRKLFVCVCLPF